MPTYKKIRGFRGYLVSDEGEIINVERNTALKPSPSKAGYLYVALFRKKVGRKFGLQTLVGKAFVPGRTKIKNQISFKDGNKSNCKPDNLFWTSHKEACRLGKTGQHDGQIGEKNPNSKLTPAKVKRIRKAYATGKWSLRSLGAKYGVASTTIHRILTRASWGEVI